MCCSYTKIVVKGMTKAEMILKVRYYDVSLYSILYNTILLAFNQHTFPELLQVRPSPQGRTLEAILKHSTL